MRPIENAMRPGTGITKLQQLGREVYRKMRVPRPESVLIFFHSLGLSHMDLKKILLMGHLWETGSWSQEWSLPPTCSGLVGRRNESGLKTLP